MSRCLVTGKQMHSRAEASREAAWWRRTRLAPRMQHYFCPLCGAYHVGNSTRPRRKNISRKARQRDREKVRR